MLNTTKKFDSFISKPLRDTKLVDVPGVGDVAASKLRDANIDTSEKLVGQFLVLGRDGDRMADWLRCACGIRVQDAAAITRALEVKTEKILMI